jgi:uncharacterized protein (DUF983 family)
MTMQAETLDAATTTPGAPRFERGAAATPFKAMRRGARGRCPSCGEGDLFRAFLKVADECPHCREELHHQRADDFPAYIVIVIVGHLVVPLVLETELMFSPPYWFHMAVWPAAIVGLGLGLLQPVKGAVVGLQWALGMHGFEAAKIAREATASNAGGAIRRSSASR